MESCPRRDDLCVREAGEIKVQNNFMFSRQKSLESTSEHQLLFMVDGAATCSTSPPSSTSTPFCPSPLIGVITSSTKHLTCDHSCHKNNNNSCCNCRIGVPSYSATSSKHNVDDKSSGEKEMDFVNVHNHDHHYCQQERHIKNSDGDEIDNIQRLVRSSHTTTKTIELEEKCIHRNSDISHPMHQPTSSNNNRNYAAVTDTAPMFSLSKSSSFPSRWPGMWFRVLVTYTMMAASVLQAHAKPTSEADLMYTKLRMDTVKYLAQFGYLQGPSTETQNLKSGKELVKAIKALQRAGNIPETGVPDSRTSDLLTRPRCGNKDEYINEGRYSNYRFRSTDRRRSSRGNGGYGSYSNDDNDDNSYHSRTYRYRRRRSLNLSRHKRFTTANSSWKHHNLTFRFVNYTPDISQGETRRAISDALRVWSDATPLSFSEVRQSDADIMIQFASNYHSDGYPFDGKGMILAHAFFPGQGKGGDTHFDDDEDWASNGTQGVKLFMVAAHEFGHALGLAHSGDPQALMYPWYMGFQGNFKLPRDDYLGITSLYGSKEKGRALPKLPSSDDGVELVPKPDVPNRSPRPDDDATPPTVDFGNPAGPPDPCSGRIDALIVFRTELFIFVGKYFWRLDSRKIVSRPIEIHSFWYGFPKTLERIDAVFEGHSSRLMFFSGDRYWIFNTNRRLAEFPIEGRAITEFNIPADVKKIDAAFVWGYNNRTYLVSGDMYWKMNKDNKMVEYDYPRDMGTWKGVPVPLDAAFKNWNGKTYFFKGRQYSEFYDMKMQVRKGYPKDFSRHMLNCPKEKADQMDGSSYQVNHPKSSLMGPEADGLTQGDEASDSKTPISKQGNPTGSATLSTSSCFSILISTLLLIFASKVATTEL